VLPLLQIREDLPSHLLHPLLGEGGVPQDIGQDLQHGGQILRQGLQGEAGGVIAGPDLQAGPDGFDGLIDLVEGAVGCAPGEGLRGERRQTDPIRRIVQGSGPEKAGDHH
jgi:hypothetical protein